MFDNLKSYFETRKERSDYKKELKYFNRYAELNRARKTREYETSTSWCKSLYSKLDDARRHRIK